MSFAINPSLTHIEIPEANILEIYRSRGQVQLSDARFRNHPCEAVICIGKVDKTVTARVALLETVKNSIFVYTSDFSAGQSSDYPKVLNEAQEFTATFGFTMEKVNLEFSPAMREVIIKGIRVMRPPLKKDKLRALNTLPDFKQSPPEAPATVSTGAEISTERLADSSELRRLRAELSSAKALMEKIGGEKRVSEENSLREINLLKEAAAKAAQAERALTEKLTQEINTLKAEKLSIDSLHNDDRIDMLELSLNKAEISKKNLQDEISRLTDKFETIKNEKIHLENKFSTERSSSAEEILKLTSEIASISSLLSAERAAATDKIAELALFETSWRESQQREEDLSRNIDLMKTEIDQLKAELEKVSLQAEREAGLLFKIEALEKEAAASRSAMKQLTLKAPERNALESEVKSLTEARNDIEAEYVRMANEVLKKETGMLEALYYADSEILRLSRELELCQQVAESEKAALRDELKQLTIAGVVARTAADPTSPVETSAAVTSPSALKSVLKTEMPIETEYSPESPVKSSAAAAAPPIPVLENLPDADLEKDENDEALIIAGEDITKGLLNEYGGICGSSGFSATTFTIDSDLCSIEYSAPGEVLVILYSSNSVQAVPDGSRVQRCKGYLIALKQSAAYKVYLVWHLAESDKVVICTPEQQPVDAVECTQMIQDAVSYFEIVGFMMEVEDLGNTVKSHNRAIRKVPGLVRK